MWWLRDHFWNFGTPVISRKRVKLETSNLAQTRTAVSTHGRRQDFLQEGANIEAPKAPSVEMPQAPRREESGEGVSPSPAD